MSDLLHQLLSHAFSRDLLRHCVWLILLCTIFAPLELLFSASRRKGPRSAILGDLGFYFISGFVPHWLLLAPLAVAAYVSYNFVPYSLHAATGSLPIWLSAVLAFIVADCGFYWGHRLVHRIPFLWRFHAVHHAPEDVYFLISARAHPIDNAIIRFCGLAPIYLIGLGAPESAKGTLIATLTMIALNVWGFFIHANVRWRYGPFERLLATPAFHHWHHTNSGVPDCNFASMLPVWDIVFGTWYLPATWTPSYGINDKMPDTVVGQLLYPLQLHDLPGVASPPPVREAAKEPELPSPTG